MEPIISLAEMSPEMLGIVSGIQPECPIRCRLLDLGFAEGAKVRCLFRSMFGDPTAYGIRGTVVALRAADSALVHVKPTGEMEP